MALRQLSNLIQKRCGQVPQKRLIEELAPNSQARARKEEFMHGTAPDSRVGVVDDVRDENHDNRQMPVIVERLDDRVHTGSIFVVLLGGRSRLHHSIGIVYQKDGNPLCLEVALNHLAPDFSNVGRKLSHMAATPNSQVKLQKLDRIAGLTREPVANRGCQLSFARPGVPAENKRWRAVQLTPGVYLLLWIMSKRPGLKRPWNQEVENRLDVSNDLINPQEPVEAAFIRWCGEDDLLGEKLSVFPGLFSWRRTVIRVWSGSIGTP